MPHQEANGVRLEYESFGDPADPLMLMVMGYGGQMISWPEGLCEGLAARGFRVVRYDNRDVGGSTWIQPPPGFDINAAVGAVLEGRPFEPPYTLEDMADDGMALARALGAEALHVVGVSMGGMIAQLMAIRHPERVLSLTSISSTPDLATAGTPTDAALEVLFNAAAPATREDYIEADLRSARITGSTGFPLDEEWQRAKAGRHWDRGLNPEGEGNHLAAMISAPDRRPALAQLRMPVLVIHGDADPLVTPDGGRATADAVPGAELLMIPGMGHDLPAGAWPVMIEAICANAAKAVPA